MPTLRFVAILCMMIIKWVMQIKRQLTDCKENKLSHLRNKILSCKVTGEEYRSILLHTDNAHNSHPTGEIYRFILWLLKNFQS